jgi:hypothetical protein
MKYSPEPDRLLKNIQNPAEREPGVKDKIPGFLNGDHFFYLQTSVQWK